MAATVKVDGAKIRRLREMAGYDQSTAAQFLGISRVGLWKIETKGRTSPARLRLMASLLGVQAEEIAAGERLAS